MISANLAPKPLAIAALLVSALTASLIFLSTFLRPSLDDYCYASVFSRYGVASPIYWFESWSGDLFTSTLGSFLVGLPLTILPLQLGSSLPYILALAVVGLVFSVLLSDGHPQPFLNQIAQFVLLVVSWLLAFWAPVALEIRLGQTFGFDGLMDAQTPSPNVMLAEWVTHWQTINSGYVIVPLLIVILFIFANKLSSTRRTLSTTLLIPVGFLAGGAPTLALSSLFAFPLGIYLFKKAGIRNNVWRLPSLVVVLASTLGLVISITSPGSRLRASNFPDPDYLGAALAAVVDLPITLIGWLALWLSVFGLIGLLGGFALAGFRNTSSDDGDPKVRARKLAAYSGFFAIASLAYTLVSTVLGNLVYSALWHTVTPRLFIFVSCVLLGVVLHSHLGILLPRLKREGWLPAITAMSWAVIIGLAIPSAMVLSGNILDRSARWEVGDAPIAGMYDISIEWVGSCQRDSYNPFWGDLNFRSVEPPG